MQARRKKKRSQGLRRDILPRLLERIVEGGLTPGSKIIESKLAAELGVSRTPLREALLHLEREGLVRCDLHRGFTIEPLSAREVREVYPLLAALECFAARSSGRLLLLVVPVLTRINADFRRSGSPDKALELDTIWHETLLSQSKNARLLALVASLRRAIRRYEHFYMVDAARISTSAAQHRAILSAIRRGDMEAIVKGIETNYLFGMQVILRKMGEE